MRKSNSLLLLLLGLVLSAAPLCRAYQEEDAYYGDDESHEGEDDYEEDYDAFHYLPDGTADFDESAIANLTLTTFKPTVQKAKYILVEFYVPWCNYCKAMRPQFAVAASAIKELDKEVLFAKVDCDEEAELDIVQEIEGYPTLYWFEHGELVEEYEGDRDSESIVEYVIRMANLPLRKLESVEELTQREASMDNTIAVGYFEDLQGPEAVAFREASAESNGCKFFVTSSADVATAAGISKAPGVAIIRTYEDREVVLFTGNITSSSLVEFAAVEQLPVAVLLDDKFRNSIFRGGITKQIILWTGQKDMQAGSPLLEAFLSVAKHPSLRGHLAFVLAEKGTEQTEAVAKLLNFIGMDHPKIGALQKEKRLKYHYPHEQITAEALLEWALSIKEGTADPLHKSAALPAKEKEDGVTVVVGSTVMKIVMDPTKDVLLEVHAPWCGHCKSFAPIYSELAGKLKHVRSLVIAKIDGTENDHPLAHASSYPTIFFYKAGDKEPVKYEGQRTVEDLIAFLQENVATPFEVEDSASGSDKDEL